MLFCLCGDRGKQGCAFRNQTKHPVKSLESPRKEKYYLKWVLWEDLRPADDHYAVAIQGATARKYRHRHKIRMKERVEQTQQQRETARATTEANIKSHVSNILFQDRKLSKEITTKEFKIDLITKTLLHEPYSSHS